MVLTVKMIKEHFKKTGNDQALQELDYLVNKERILDERYNRYISRIVDFARKFGAYTVHFSSDTYILAFESHCHLYKELAKNLGLDYYKYYDEDGNEATTEIPFPKHYFDDIMHYYTNIYPNHDFDIYQSKLKVIKDG